MEMAAVAVVGHHLCSRLVDVTDDLGALESNGFWAVTIDFSGKAVCARFDSVRPARPWRGRPWKGLPADTWSSSLDRKGFAAGVSAIREMIAAGDVYQVNLTRRVSAPVRPAGRLRRPPQGVGSARRAERAVKDADQANQVPRHLDLLLRHPGLSP